jgi:site-specific DNA-methyltransferase (adenine-specific)
VVATDGRRQATATSSFGVSRRENHDASAFYERFVPPKIEPDDAVLAPFDVGNPFRNADARHMDDLPDGSVALVVTSPPYFAGKQYEQELDRDGVPGSYSEYLDLLTDVFSECKRKLEPGGRIAVNVANLGRKPYRSLSADVIWILQDKLRLLLRGEVLWQKGEGASGSCAWGSFRSAANPALRDLTERIVIASKGRFDRAKSVAERKALGLPHRNTVTADEFMAATLDVWQIPPESAKRVDHPAPFPVELPERLILLNTFENDLVLDPFMGSGSALVAAARHGRRYVGYDLDAAYCATAQRRVASELARRDGMGSPTSNGGHRRPAATTRPVDDTHEHFQQRAAAEGKAAPALAASMVSDAGFRVVGIKRRLRGLGVDVSLVAYDAEGQLWLFDVSGAFTTTRSGLHRTDTLLRTLGKAQVIANAGDRLGHLHGAPLVLLTSHLPPPGSDGDRALRVAGPTTFFDAVEMLDDGAGLARLRTYARGGHRQTPLLGFWSPADLT